MLLLIAATMTVAGLLTSGANVAGNVYDKMIIDESLETMQNTVETMQNKMEEETDPVKKQEKLLKAQSLNETQDKLTKLGDKYYKISMQSEAVNISKTLISAPDGAAEIVETSVNAFAVADTSAQTAIAIAKSGGDDTAPDGRTDTWAKVADSSDECEIQILIAKARQLTKEAKVVREEATKMADYYKQEKQGQITSRQVEDKLADIVEESPELQEEIKKNIWDHLDSTDTQVGTSNTTNADISSNNSSSGSSTSKDTPESKTIIKNTEEKPNTEKPKDKSKYSEDELTQIIINKFQKKYPNFKADQYEETGTWYMNEDGNTICRGSGVEKCDFEGISFRVFNYEEDVYEKTDFLEHANSKKEEAEYEYDEEYDMRHQGGSYNPTYFGETIAPVEYANQDFYVGIIEYWCYPYMLSLEADSIDRSTVSSEMNVFKEVFSLIGKCQ